MENAIELRLVFFPWIALWILANRPPVKTPLVTPCVKHDALRKGLPFGGDHDAIVLGKRSGKGFSPVEFERFEL